MESGEPRHPHAPEEPEEGRRWTSAPDSTGLVVGLRRQSRVLAKSTLCTVSSVTSPPTTLVTLCTGNAARSVMAGAMLQDAPMAIVTAGTHVIEGQPMSRRTRAAMESVGYHADGHRSHQITQADIDNAVLILAMAAEHVAYIRRRHPEAASRTASIKRLVRDLPAGPQPLADRLASLDLGHVELGVWEDVEDPAGGQDEVYVSCATEIQGLCEALVPLLG